ncbi:MAG: ADOP family duplicated permease [Gemmatimonadaceae bacterium]
MRWISDAMFRLRALLSRRSLERQLDEEFAFHLDMQARKLRAEGMAPEQAAREAGRRFGDQFRAREQARDRWGITLADQLVADTTYALRQFVRRPAFTITAVLTLGIGIGTTVAIFSAVRGLMLQSLPIPAEDRVHVFWFDMSWRGEEFDFLRNRRHGFQALAAYGTDAARFESPTETQLLFNVVSSAELFDVLGVRPLIGRGFAPGEDRPGAEPVIVISHGVWQQELGGDPGVIGRRLLLNGVPTTIIGVMPQGFFFPTPQFRAWRPLALDPATADYANNGWLTLIARSRPDTDPARVRRDVEALGPALGERFTYTEAWDKTRSPSATPLRQYVLGDTRKPLVLLMSAVAVLLLMATANAAALLLARTTDRREELSLRTALGAGRGRIARQIVTESVTLALVAGIAGVVMAVATFRALVASLPIQDDLRELLVLDWSSFGSAVAIAILVGIAVAVLPVRQLVRSSDATTPGRVRSDAGGTSGGTRRVHALLVAGEVTLATLLVVGATLMIRTVDQLRSIDPGFEPSGVYTFDVLTGAATTEPGARRAFYRDVLDRVSQIPGVTHAGLSNRLPLRDGGWQGPVLVADRPDLVGASRPSSYYRVVTPDFLAAMGAAMAEGRGIEASDRAGAPGAALVNEAFARRIWPGQTAVGKRVSMGMDGGRDLTVVGVIRDMRMVSMVGDNPMAVYVPVDQSVANPDGLVLAVRHSTSPDALVAAVREIVRDRDSGALVLRPAPLDRAISAAISEPIRLRFLLSLLGALALVLGAVGVYGVVAYSVARRQAEFGIRMALGATPSRVRWEVMRDGLLPVAVGLCVGLVSALGLSRLVSGFLYGVTPTDAVSLLAAAAALLVGGAAAALVPAARAGRVSPREALAAS